MHKHSYLLSKKGEKCKVVVGMSDRVLLLLCFFLLSFLASEKRFKLSLCRSFEISGNMVTSGNSISKPELHFSIYTEIKSLLSVICMKKYMLPQSTESNSVKHVVCKAL